MYTVREKITLAFLFMLAAFLVAALTWLAMRKPAHAAEPMRIYVPEGASVAA